MSQQELKRLAKLIFQIAHREVWWGGRVQAEKDRWGRVTKKVSPNWPEGVTIPQDWSVGVTWTLSPVVTLGGNSMQVCVSSHSAARGHSVRVFVDGELCCAGVQVSFSPLQLAITIRVNRIVFTKTRW